MDAIEAALRKLLSEVQTMRDEVATVKEDVVEMRDIVKAWEAVKTGGAFLKWLGAISAAVVAIVLAVKAAWHVLIK